MPSMTLNKATIYSLLKRKMKDSDLLEAINMLGPSVEEVVENDISVEVTANRPDLLSEEGMARALSSFMGIKPGLKKYAVKKSNQKVIVDESVNSVRPHTACAIVKGLKFNDERIKEIIQVQEKLHVTYGRNRKKCAIGIYPLEHIRTPIRFTAKRPEDIVFAPLDLNKDLNASQILALHPTGREYGHLLVGEKKYPIFIDAKNNILSMPPIINSNTVGKITEKTRDVFIEVSGFDMAYLNTALCILVAAIADMGGEIYSMEVVKKGKKTITPDFSPMQFKLDVQTVNKTLGTNISEADMRKLLAKMGHDYGSKTVFSPRWRADILHPSDLIEDIAIAIGYSNIPLQKPSAATTGKEDPAQSFQEAIRETLVGGGYLEIKNFDLISEAVQTKFVNIQQKPVGMANSFNEEYNTLRASLLPGVLLTIKENKTQEYPQRIFEIGTVFSHDPSQEALVKEQDFLAVAMTDSVATYTGMKQVLGTIATGLNITVQTPEGSHSALISGRTASIEANGIKIGTVGEVHPEVLENFQIEMPVAYLEIDLNALLHATKTVLVVPANTKEQPATKNEKKSQKGKQRQP